MRGASRPRSEPLPKLCIAQGVGMIALNKDMKEQPDGRQ